MSLSWVVGWCAASFIAGVAAGVFVSWRVKRFFLERLLRSVPR